MAVRHYLAVIERAADGYGVFFPDLPGCTSGGSTLEEAAINAEEALRGHVEVSIEEGQALPAPSGLDDMHVDPEVDEATRLLVRVDMPGATVRVNITVPDDVLAAVDRFVEREGFTRSGFFTQAAREKMARERAGYAPELFARSARRDFAFAPEPETSVAERIAKEIAEQMAALRPRHTVGETGRTRKAGAPPIRKTGKSASRAPAKR